MFTPGASMLSSNDSWRLIHAPRVSVSKHYNKAYNAVWLER